MAKKDGKESTIGKVIYGFLMFAPLIAIGTSCAYSIINKNATEEMTRTVQPTTLIVGNTYHIDFKNYNTTQEENLKFGKISNLEIQIGGESVQGQWLTNMLYVTADSYAYLGASDEQQYYNFTGSFDFTFLSCTNVSFFTQFITEQVKETKDLRNTFYYSLDRVQEEDVFKWAKNNEIYTGLKAVTDGLTIETEFIPMILSYWLIISVIYFMYDILLIIFHILHNNIHKLESM